MKSIFTVVLGSLLLGAFLVFCGVEDIDFLEGLPDKESLKVKFPTRSGQLTSEEGTVMLKKEGETADFYLFTKRFTDVVNGGVYFLLSLAEDIAKSPGGKRDGDTKVWGPYTPGGLDPLTYKFTLTRLSSGKWSYKLETHGKDSEEFKVIMSGEHTRGTKYRRGTGNLMVDFTTLKSMDPSKVEEGKIEAVYNTETPPYTLDVKFIDFVGRDSKSPVNSTYKYSVTDGGEGEFSYDAVSDMDNKGKEENLKVLSRWKSDGAGRSDARVTGGDVQEQGINELDISECWDTNYKSIYYESFVNNQSYEKYGDPSKCAYSDTKLP